MVSYIKQRVKKAISGRPYKGLQQGADQLFDALISPILFYASEVWGIDCKGKLEKDPEEFKFKINS